MENVKLKSKHDDNYKKKHNIFLIKQMISGLIAEIDDNWSSDKCKGYNPGCANCQGQILLGHLYSYLDLLEWEEKENITY